MKKILLVLVMTLSFMGFSMAPIHAQSTDGASAACQGIGAAVGSTGGCKAVTPSPSIDHVVTTVIDILSIAVGIIAVIMIMIGGIKYITSSGDSNNVASAKNTIIYAIVGLVVVALAQIIVKFVLGKLTKT